MRMMCIKQLGRLTPIMMVFSALLLLPTLALGETDEAVDYVSLAERLYADGHLLRAERDASTCGFSQEEIDLKAYYLVSGLIALQRKRYGDAVASLTHAIELGEERTLVFLGLAQGYFHQGDYTKALGALRRSNPPYGGIVAGYLMAAQSHWALDQKSDALSVLKRATQRFPDDVSALRQNVLYLVELGLYHEAIVASDSLMKHGQVKEEDFIAVAHALRKARQPFQTITLLEQALMYRSSSTRLKQLLAHAYHDAGKPYAAGLIFESLTIGDPKYAYEAAQAFKTAKRYVELCPKTQKCPRSTNATNNG